MRPRRCGATGKSAPGAYRQAGRPTRRCARRQRAARPSTGEKASPSRVAHSPQPTAKATTSRTGTAKRRAVRVALRHRGTRRADLEVRERRVEALPARPPRGSAPRTSSATGDILSVSRAPADAAGRRRARRGASPPGGSGSAMRTSPIRLQRSASAEHAERAEAEPVAAEPPIAEPGEDDISAGDGKDRHQARPQPLRGEGKPGASDRAFQAVELGVRRGAGSQHRFIIHVLRLNSTAQDDGHTKACDE